MKYFVACLFAAAVIAALFYYAQSCRQQFLVEFRASLRQEWESGNLPESISEEEIETASPEGWNLSLESKTMNRLGRADIIERLWFLWIPVVVLLCLFLAKLWPNQSGVA
ncbi:MAG: hypothetical protein HUJ26_09955 [Planctomycetaceae bacterium]|nr:hypothetical protein [Planctomycetaceae bacterium]